ncbi:response regulator transcription factor [Paucibacter sp. PLA-PC-4]|uniref:LuxR C-terminal-related transcriptional regulator n=1 Tax=Paucibacter sp. PLA-PC-4 TaxID=2993655 RepID=UPI00224A8137|nr:response regulator transcription factor [Paucibacter sp. PLA-PC-4]MCX2863566.1 response regulator transcription factor [Paucibacter sp. PLA-PC-4]
MNPTQTRPVVVLVMHAEPLFARGLQASLQELPGLRVLSAQPGEHYESDIRVDVVVTDYAGGMRLASAARQGNLPGALAQARILVVTDAHREHEVRQALEFGIQGYLLNDCREDELFDCVRTLAQGSRYLCPMVAQRMADSLARQPLTNREVEVLQLLSQGRCNKSIARQLEIEVTTAKAHVKAILGKLHASSRTEAASIASLRGLVHLQRPATVRSSGQIAFC